MAVLSIGHGSHAISASKTTSFVPLPKWLITLVFQKGVQITGVYWFLGISCDVKIDHHLGRKRRRKLWLTGTKRTAWAENLGMCEGLKCRKQLHLNKIWTASFWWEKPLSWLQPLMRAKLTQDKHATRILESAGVSDHLCCFFGWWRCRKGKRGQSCNFSK